MDYIVNTLDNLVHQTAFFNLTLGNYAMIVVACVFLYLAIAKGFEPLLLTPIAFGMLLVNIYPDIMISIEESANGTGGLLYYFYLLDEGGWPYIHIPGRKAGADDAPWPDCGSSIFLYVPGADYSAADYETVNNGKRKKN